MATNKRARRRLPWQDDFKVSDFFARNSVFRFDEFAEAHRRAGRAAESTKAILHYHLAQGNLVHLRRGLYANQRSPDFFVVGSKLTRDAVIAYDGAWLFHGYGGPVHGITVISRERLHHFVYNEVVYRAVLPPVRGEGLRTLSVPLPSILQPEREGQVVHVTSRERTFVDLLDRPEFGPQPLEWWKELRAARGLDLDAMVDHALALESGLTAARLGFFLESLGAPSALLERLWQVVPRSRQYLNRQSRQGEQTLVSRWKLLVPLDLLLAVERGGR